MHFITNTVQIEAIGCENELHCWKNTVYYNPYVCFYWRIVACEVLLGIWSAWNGCKALGLKVSKVIGSIFSYIILNKITWPLHMRPTQTQEWFLKQTNIWTITSVMFGIMYFICTLDWSVYLIPFTSIWQADTFYTKRLLVWYIFSVYVFPW